MFNFLFKIMKNTISPNSSCSATKNIFFVDNMINIELPNYWIIESEKPFIAKSLSKDLKFRIVNFGKSLSKNDFFNKQNLIDETKELFSRLINDCNYIPIYEDCIIGSDFVYQSFIVEDQIQYLYFSYKIKNNQLFRSDLILSVKKPFKVLHKDELLKIGASISV